MIPVFLATTALMLVGVGPVQAPKLKPNAPKSIELGLAWLARHQNPDGSWGGNSLMQRCTGEKPCYDKRADLTGHYDEGLTGLAVLSFLRAGSLDASAPVIADTVGGKSVNAPAVVRSGLTWLKKVQKKSGSFGRDRPFLYNDAIAALAMIEAYSVTKDEAWKECAAKGIAFLQAAQRANPTGDGLWGWRYSSRQEIEQFKPKDPAAEDLWKRELHDSDVSATGWAVAAIAAAGRTDLVTKSESLSGALDFLNYATKTNGLVGYLDSEGAGVSVTGPFDEFRYHVGTMSSIGILIRSSASNDKTNAFYDLAVTEILKDTPRQSSDGLRVDYYYWYHGTLALNRLEGSEGPKKAKRKVAEPWNKALLESLTELQDRTKDACSHGGWVVPDRWNLHAGGPVYSTAMGVLALEAVKSK